MLISYKYKSIFVHNPKAAGSSIRLALQNYAIDSPLALPWFNLLCENTKIGRKISGHTLEAHLRRETNLNHRFPKDKPI